MLDATGSYRKQRFGMIGCIAVLLVGISTTASGQVSLTGASDGDWTVLTMATDGAWGAATEEHLYQALSKAITRCRTMSAKRLNCGAYSVNVQGRWAIGARCGNENILAAGTTLIEATDRVQRRTNELRHDYHPDMPVCRVIVTIAPGGVTSAPGSETEISVLSRIR